MSRLEIVEHDVEIVRRQYSFATGWIQMILIVGVWWRTRWRARRRVRLFILIRQLHTRHPDGASHVLVDAMCLARAARCCKEYVLREMAQKFIHKSLHVKGHYFRIISGKKFYIRIINLDLNRWNLSWADKFFSGENIAYSIFICIFALRILHIISILKYDCFLNLI